ncbi:MAG: reductive dehalogenase [Candidatus Heimdallarchaeota archaeon]|nr:MAG: reductive dehalogenase [Candidatus Heimdallarchaeota archaeon]
MSKSRSRVNSSQYRGKYKSIPDPFPVHKLKRVDRPTTRIKDYEVQRVSELDGGFQRANRGEFGSVIQKEYDRFVEKHPLSDSLLDMSKILASAVDGPIRTEKAPLLDDPHLLSNHVKEVAYFLRADLVGICELPPYAVFTHDRWKNEPIELKHKYAIGILIDQDWKTARAFNGSDWISNSMSFLGYSTSGFIACILANYIRKLGFPARAHHATNYQVVVPPILLWAGLGEMSRIGDTVLNPFLGPRFKAAIVTTDLPLAIDKPIDFGLQDFCQKCKKCAEYCPTQALSYGNKVWHNGYEKWPVDIARCTKNRVGNHKGSGCGTCIKVCPWNKPNTRIHNFVGWTMRKIPFARRFAAWGDEVLGYSKPKSKWKWWFDLEDVDGTLTIPKYTSKKLKKYKRRQTKKNKDE